MNVASKTELISRVLRAFFLEQRITVHHICILYDLMIYTQTSDEMLHISVPAKIRYIHAHCAVRRFYGQQNVKCNSLMRQEESATFLSASTHIVK